MAIGIGTCELEVESRREDSEEVELTREEDTHLQHSLLDNPENDKELRKWEINSVNKMIRRERIQKKGSTTRWVCGVTSLAHEFRLCTKI
jgi:hypothetical protein